SFVSWSARPLCAPLFPYTTLFRSLPAHLRRRGARTPARGSRRERHQFAAGVRGAALRLARARRAQPRADARRRAELRGRTAFGSDRKSTRLNSSHVSISYAVFCLK